MTHSMTSYPVAQAKIAEVTRLKREATMEKMRLEAEINDLVGLKKEAEQAKARSGSKEVNHHGHFIGSRAARTWPRLL